MGIARLPRRRAAFVAFVGTQIVTLLGIHGRVVGYTVFGMALAGILSLLRVCGAMAESESFIERQNTTNSSRTAHGVVCHGIMGRCSALLRKTARDCGDGAACMDERA